LVPVHVAVNENVVTPSVTFELAVIVSVVVPVGVVFCGLKLPETPVGSPETVQFRLPQFGSNVPDGKLHVWVPVCPGSSWMLVK